jgi:hypothetical protein
VPRWRRKPRERPHKCRTNVPERGESDGNSFRCAWTVAFSVDLWEADSPHRSETRLNRFLIKLGRDLASIKERRTLPDWLHNIDQTERFIVEGWCESITVDDERWPSLCCFTTPALVKLLKLCNVKHCELGTKDARTIERSIQRLGLVRIHRRRIKHVEKSLVLFASDNSATAAQASPCRAFKRKRRVISNRDDS